MKKYILTSENHPTNSNLFRIKALKDFGNIKKDDLGGFVEREENLSQEGDCWVFDKAQVFGETQVFAKAWVR